MSDNRFRVLRWKGPDDPSDVDADDPDWFGDWQHPNSGRYTVGGTASDGDYVFTLTPVRSDWPGETPHETFSAISVTTTRSTTPATNADLAAQIVSDINDAVEADRIAGSIGIAQYIQAATNPSGALVYVQYKEPGHDFVVSTTAPGSGTFTHLDGSSQGSGNRFPCARKLAFQNLGLRSSSGAVEVTVHPITSAGATVDPGTCTYSIQIIKVINRKTDAGADDWAYVSLGTLSSQVPGTPHSVSLDGADALAVRLSSIANEPGTTDRFEIRYQEVAT